MIRQHEPVIAGSGLTGLLISDRLSQEEIPHVLLGDPPGDQPRLGESLDPAGTLALLEAYPELDDFYYKKAGISVFLGDYATACDFSPTLARSLGLRMLGFPAPDVFIDMDRVGFDRALHERVEASEYCTRRESLVDTIDSEEGSDRVEALHLEGGETLEPDYVFDCTNFVRLLGRELGIPVEGISEPQRVVFTDYHALDPAKAQRRLGDSMKHADHLLRLYEDLDGLDGLAWAIPIGSYTSVGVSMPLDQDLPDEKKVLALVEEAYRRRGMHLFDVFNDPDPPVDVPQQQYFVHERAFGRNWMMAGPSYGQFWFPTASGVGTSLLAAQIAPQALETPEEAPRRFQAYVDGLRESHHVFDRMITRDRDEITEELVESETERIMTESAKRVARMAIVQKGPLAGGVGRLFEKAVGLDGVVAGDCPLYEADIARQKQEILDDG